MEDRSETVAVLHSWILWYFEVVLQALHKPLMRGLGIASQDLALFTYFNIDIDLARRVIYCCEAVDKTLSHRIELQSFAEKYAPQSVNLFKYLWNGYFLTKVKRSNLLHHIDWGSVPEYSPTYAEFLPFLFFIVSLKDRDILRYLYWFHFKTFGGFVLSSDSLLQLSSQLWQDKLGKYDTYKPKLQFFLSQRSDFHDFDMDTFIIYSLKCNGIFNKPILAFQSSVKQLFIGYSFWIHISERYKQIYVTNEDSLQLFDNLKRNIHSELQSTNGISQAGEIIRNFIHNVSEFKDAVEQNRNQFQNFSISSKSSQVPSLDEARAKFSFDWVRKLFLKKTKVESLLQHTAVSPPLFATYDPSALYTPHRDDSNEQLLAKAAQLRQYALKRCQTSIEHLQRPAHINQKI